MGKGEFNFLDIIKDDGMVMRWDGKSIEIGVQSRNKI